MKLCPCCNKYKNISNFSKATKRKDGLFVYCKSCIHTYYLLNQIKIKNKSSLWYKNNYKWAYLRNKEYYLKNREIILLQRSKFRKKNKIRLNKASQECHKTQYKRDIKYKILSNCRTRLWSSLKGINKSLNTIFLIGCEVDYLMYHLQEQFKPGMSWDNYGDWEIDHIKPCDAFDMRKYSEQKKCFSYKNLQPLWSGENREKSNKLY